MLGLRNLQWLVYFLLAVQLELQQSGPISPLLHEYNTLSKMLWHTTGYVISQLSSSIRIQQHEYS